MGEPNKESRKEAAKGVVLLPDILQQIVAMAENGKADISHLKGEIKDGDLKATVLSPFERAIEHYMRHNAMIQMEAFSAEVETLEPKKRGSFLSKVDRFNETVRTLRELMWVSIKTHVDSSILDSPEYQGLALKRDGVVVFTRKADIGDDGSNCATCDSYDECRSPFKQHIPNRQS